LRSQVASLKGTIQRKSVSSVFGSSIKSEMNSNSCEELTASHAMVQNQKDRIGQLDEEIEALKKENECLRKDNHNTLTMVHEFQARLEHLAAEADEKAMLERAELKKLAVESCHESKTVEISFSYNASLQTITHQMIEAMNMKHELDAHRIVDLEERCALLSRQAKADYMREHKAIENWQIALAECSKMRMDIYKLTITTQEHDHELIEFKRKCEHWELTCKHWESKFKEEHVKCTELKIALDGEIRCRDKWQCDFNEVKIKWEGCTVRITECEKEIGHWKHKCGEWEHQYLEVHEECKVFKITIGESCEKLRHLEEKNAHLKAEIEVLKVKIVELSSNDCEDAHKIKMWREKYEHEHMEHEALKHRLHELTVHCEALKISCNDWEHKYAHLEKEYHGMKHRCEEWELKYSHLYGECSHLKIEIQQLKKDRAMLTLKLEGCRRKVKELEIMCAEWKHKCHHLEHEHGELEIKI